jgi:hypothetical protein
MFIRQVVSVMAIGLFGSCLFAQGLQTKASKDDWEEINFEFNSAILSDGYPSLLRLAELLQQHRDYKVQIEGHTDYVGSVAYNEKLALARAGTIRDFLVKYGAGANQIAVSGQGKRTPEVPNTTKEGRFINRRVVMTVTDATGKVIAAGGVSDVVTSLDDRLKKLEDCCNAILKKLDKLDDILAAIRDLKAENDRLKADVAGLKEGAGQTTKQIAELPKPLNSEQTTAIARTEATNAANNALAAAEAARKRFSLIGINAGPSKFGELSLSGSGRFFAPFKQTHAVQIQGEYLYYHGSSRPNGRQEGQFDIGLVNRFGQVQAGVFSSLKFVNISQFQNGGTLGQAAFTLDYIFKRGRIGGFATQGFKNRAVINRANLGPTSFVETFLQIANQYGGSGLVGLWGDSYVEANLAYVGLRGGQDPRPGGMLRFVQPVSQQVAFTVEGGWNETFVSSKDTGRIVFGLQFGNWLRPKEYGDVTHPVPVDVPRVRYQLLTRRVGNSAPVADAGPDQIGVAAGTVTLNGTGSFDPEGDPLTFQWTQIAGPSVSLTGQNTATATFTAVAGQTYSFRLTVKDPGGLQSTARTTVTTTAAPSIIVARFTATPDRITRGSSTLLEWNVQGATTVTISPELGTVQPIGSRTVTPNDTTTYTLTASANGVPDQRATVTVTVGAAVSNPSIVRFEATPTNITQGESSTLSWATSGATRVSISGVGDNLPTSGSRVVTPAQTTTFTLTAFAADNSSVTAPVIVTVSPVGTPRILQFSLNPSTINPGESAQLCWNVENATTVSIQPGIGTVKATDCITVTPSATTTYTLTASSGTGTATVSSTATATLTVGGVKILMFSQSPEFSQSAGAPVVLSWTTSGATSVQITGFGAPAGSLPANGSITVNPNTNTDYSLTAYGSGGQTVTVVLHVFVR